MYLETSQPRTIPVIQVRTGDITQGKQATKDLLDRDEVMCVIRREEWMVGREGGDGKERNRSTEGREMWCGMTGGMENGGARMR